MDREQILRKLVVVALFVAVYFMVWRPVREQITQKLLFPLIERSVTSESVVQPYSDGKTTIILVRTDVNHAAANGEATSLRPQTSKSMVTFNGFGNAFFLLGSVVILAFNLSWKHVLQLFLIHQGITVLALISLFLAVSTHPAWLYPMNLLVTYITPAATGMFVLMRKRLTRDA